MEKTNVMRLLDVAKIEYKAHEYPMDVVDGLSVAKELGENPECVFKTLVCVSSNKEYVVFCVPVTGELNLKKAAKAAGCKAIELIPQKQLLPLTGYVHGGCSPIGMKKAFPTYIDETAMLFDTIYVSGGRRGHQVEVNPQALLDYVHGSFVDLTD